MSYQKREDSCSIEECDSPVRARGWCNKHYLRWNNHGDPEFTVLGHLDAALCTKCQLNPRKDNHSWCSECCNSESRRRNRGGLLQREKRYKLSEEDIYYMWLYQGGRCASCQNRLDFTASKSFHVDHDNECCSKEVSRNKGTCGECVRGLLCSSCNQGLGNFKDDIQRLKGAIAYLTQMKAGQE